MTIQIVSANWLRLRNTLNFDFENVNTPSKQMWKCVFQSVSWSFPSGKIIHGCWENFAGRRVREKQKEEVEEWSMWCKHSILHFFGWLADRCHVIQGDVKIQFCHLGRPSPLPGVFWTVGAALKVCRWRNETYMPRHCHTNFHIWTVHDAKHTVL